MIRLVLHHLRRTAPVGLLAALAVFAFQAFAVRVFQAIITGPQAAQADLLGRVMPAWVQRAMGLEGPVTSLPAFLTLVWQHPFLLAVVLAVPLVAASSFLAGEVERRTLALLLARPVGRLQILASAAFVAVLWPALSAAAAWGGTWAGVRWTGTAPPDWRALALVAGNLYLLALASAGFALAASAMVKEKGDAVGWCVTVLLLMYVGHFLAQMYSQSAHLSQWMIFHYYTPGRLLGLPPVGGEAAAVTGAAPDPVALLTWNARILGAVGGAGLVTAAVVWARRNFCV